MSQQSTQAFDALNRIVVELRSRLVLIDVILLTDGVPTANDSDVGAMNNERELL